MAISARDLNDSELPARTGTTVAHESGLAYQIALADRIAELRNIVATEDAGDTVPRRAEVYLQPPYRSIRRRPAPRLLYTVGPDGLTVLGLTEWDRHQVLSRGWGQLRDGHVVLYWPRNDEELDVCWQVVQRAYEFLSRVSENSMPARKVSPWDLPRFSRTTLQ